MNKSYGQVACETFLPPEHQNDDKLCWENLDTILKDHWEDAAWAVIDAYNASKARLENGLEP